MADDDENFAPLQSSEEIVGEMSFSQVKAELKRRGLSAKGRKTTLTARLIDVFRQEKSKPSSSHESVESTIAVQRQALSANNGSAESTGDHLWSQSSSHQLSEIQLLRRKEKILKMDIDAVIQVILETSKSPINNAIKMENRVQKLNGYLESCSEVRDEIIALIPDNEIAEEAQKWIDYQTAIDNTLDIAQEYLSKLSSPKVDEQATSGSAECKRSLEITKIGVT